MIEIIISTDASRRRFIENPETTTPRQICEKVGTQFTSLNGSDLDEADLDKTFSQLGVKGLCTMGKLTKLQNGNNGY